MSEKIALMLTIEQIRTLHCVLSLDCEDMADDPHPNEDTFLAVSQLEELVLLIEETVPGRVLFDDPSL
jgi:hypothetical protein